MPRQKQSPSDGYQEASSPPPPEQHPQYHHEEEILPRAQPSNYFAHDTDFDEEDAYYSQQQHRRACFPRKEDVASLRNMFARKKKSSNVKNKVESNLHDKENSNNSKSFNPHLSAMQRTGSLPTKNEHNNDGVEGATGGGVGGIYYTAVSKSNPLRNNSALADEDNDHVFHAFDNDKDDDDDAEVEEALGLEAIAARRAVIRDSWDFYRMVCSVLRDRRKYNHVFERMQLDSVYPYLNSMTGLHDSSIVQSSIEQGRYFENPDKEVSQPNLPEYANMTRTAIAKDLVARAEAVKPRLIEVVQSLAAGLRLRQVGVAPIKLVSAALRKAEKKYKGDILKVTDFCRAMLVVQDIPSLLALMELARGSFGRWIRRVKMSTLKADYQPKAGGYRDCIINVELKSHICEIQVHLFPMWVVCGVDGYRHYRHCLEYNTDSFVDAYDALDGVERKTMSELIVVAEEDVAETPLESLEWYHEKYILNYFAEAGLFLKHNLMAWAEATLVQLIRLRTESPDIGPHHEETMILNLHLISALQAQGKTREAALIHKRIEMYQSALGKRIDDEVGCRMMKNDVTCWETFLDASSDVYDTVIDPARRDREKDELLRRQVKASKRAWMRTRYERFSFLDAESGQSSKQASGSSKEDP
ncbi:hypothetical protein ACA910_008042 [Epithemia clementina (nom. ined.)]